MHRPAVYPSTSLACALLTLALSSLSLAANALDLTVTTGEDQFDGVCAVHCSLRDAVVVANARPGPDRILLGAGAYTLSLPAPSGETRWGDQPGDTLDDDANLNGDLDITDELSIIGLGAEQTFVRGSPSARDRVFEVLATGRLRLERLAVENGFTSFYGGGLENHGQVSLDRVSFNFNEAIGTYEGLGIGLGGGIANYGSLVIDSSRFQDNLSFNYDSASSEGGAILNRGTLTVRDSHFTGNKATGTDEHASFGGAISNQGHADISRSAFIDNQVREYGTGAAIHNGTLWNAAFPNGVVLKLSNSTLSASIGASAFSNGQAWPSGKAVPKAQLVNVTIAGNTGGLENFGQLSLRNSLIIGNYDSFIEDEARNCNTTGPNATYRAYGLLLGNGPGNCTAELYRENSEAFTRVLYPLADNNQPRLPTHALRPGSPAVDAGLGSCTRQDQRGASRPRDGDGDGVAVCDLGAYERPKP
ncbi:MAG: choice-of-anchor Q domain-containing protein [Pseudomonadota bacterium]